MVSQGLSASDKDELMMKFFKYPNATYLTSHMFDCLRLNLVKGLELINGNKTKGNILD